MNFNNLSTNATNLSTNGNIGYSNVNTEGNKKIKFHKRSITMANEEYDYHPEQGKSVSVILYF